MRELLRSSPQLEAMTLDQAANFADVVATAREVLAGPFTEIVYGCPNDPQGKRLAWARATMVAQLCGGEVVEDILGVGLFVVIGGAHVEVIIKFATPPQPADPAALN